MHEPSDDKKSLVSASSNGNGSKIYDLTEQLTELQKANKEIREARRAALNLMEDAILSKEALRLNEERMRRQKEAFQAAVNGAPLKDSLNVVADMVAVETGARTAFYIADEKREYLHPVIGAGNMPEEYLRRIDGFIIGEDSLACGLAVPTNKPVITPDVLEEPIWKQWAYIAEEFSYRGCWSFPIRTREDKAIGTFAMYFTEPRAATQNDIALAEMVTQTAVVIIFNYTEAQKRLQAENALRRSEEKYRIKLEQDVRDRTAELHASKELLQTTIDSSLDVIQVFHAVRDESNKIVDFVWVMNNKKGIEQNGDVLGNSLLNKNPGIVKSGIFERMVTVTETGTPDECEQYYNFEQFNGWFYQALVKSDDGVVMTTRDITEQKKTERQIKESKELLQATMDASMDMIQVFEAVRDGQGEIVDFHYVLINHEAERWMPANTIGSTLLQLQPGVLEEGIFDTFKKVVETGIPDQSERHYVHEQFNGWFHQSVVKLGDGVATTTADITQRKQAELEVLRLKDEAAKRATDKYEKLFNSIDEGFEIVELVYNDAGEPVDFLYLETNPAFERQTGLTNVEGKLGREVSPGIETYWLEAYDKVVKTGEPIRLENYNAFTQRWYSSYGFLAENEHKRQIAVLFNDITERKRREQEQALLLKLGDSIKPLTDLVTIEGEVTSLLREHFDAGWCYYVEWDEVNKIGVVLRDAARKGLPSLVGKHYVSDVPEYLELIKANQLVNVSDYENYEMLTPELRQRYTALGFRSMLVATLVKQDRLVASLLIGDNKIRHWSKNDETLLMDVAERTWAEVERAKAEEALHVSEARLRTLADAVPQVIWANNAEGNANYFNQRWYEYSGLTFEQSVGLGWQVIVHPDDAPASIEKWNNALAAGEVFDTEYRLKRYDGNYRWFIGRNVPLKDEAGKVTGWFGSATDIEELKRTTEALSHSEARLKITMESSTDYAIITMDTERKIERWSKGAEQIFGYTEAEVIGKSADIIFTEEDRKAGAPQKEMETARETSRAADERWHRRKDGSRFYVSGVLRPIKNEQVTGYVKVLRDMTQQQLFTEELHRLVAERTMELQRSNEDLRQFAHVASHDLKEPVRKIKTFNNRIIDDFSDALPEKVKMYLNKVGDSANRMFAMIEGVLNFSKAGSTQQALEPVDLNEIIQDILTDLEVLVKQKNARVTTNDLPHLQGYKVLLYQLFYNLILNSLKFAKADEPSRIDITCEVVNQDKEKWYKIVLSDNGIGFEQEYAESIFGAFTRLNGMDEYEGTGLGLALCKKIVERHGGSIGASGELGNGAIFTIMLPAK